VYCKKIGRIALHDYNNMLPQVFNRVYEFMAQRCCLWKAALFYSPVDSPMHQTCIRVMHVWCIGEINRWIKQRSQRVLFSIILFIVPAGGDKYRGDTVGISWICLMLIKLEWLGYRTVKKNYDNMLTRFHLIPERHGQTELLYQYRASVIIHTFQDVFWLPRSKINVISASQLRVWCKLDKNLAIASIYRASAAHTIRWEHLWA